MKHFHQTRYILLAYVVMDDHVHLIVKPLSGFELGEIVHSWKSFTSHEINKLCKTTGKVWLDECYDRIIRDEQELHEKLNYILTNPQKRWPDTTDYVWAELLTT